MESRPATMVHRGVRRDAGTDLTRRKREELAELAARWHQARDFYLDRLARSDDLTAVVLRPRSLRERQRDEGWAPVDLAVHYHQTAFLSAAAEVKTNWLATLGRIRWKIGRRRDLSDDQKHWLRFVMRRVQLVQRCVDGESVSVTDAWAQDLDQARECRRLRRLVQRAYSPSRHARRRDWFVLDGRLYRPFLRPTDRHYGGAWISLTGTQKRRRICVPLRGRGLRYLEPRPGLTEGPEIRVEVGSRVVFRTSERVHVASRSGGDVAGIDKGHDTLVTATLGVPEMARTYGAGVGKQVSAMTVKTEEEIRFRRRIAAYERSLRNTSAHKAKRIRRCNLGRVRRSNDSRKVATTFRNMVDRALNQMFRDHASVALLYVEALDFVGARRGHAFNRRLRRWLKGYLHERLQYKAELNGVELKVVNAAYTSQTCPRCWFTSAKNRHAQRFECGSCGYAGSADAVAATNVLRRGSDPAITRFMPSGAVKQILEERSRSALNGGAWGSNGVALGEDVSRDERCRRSREELRKQSIGTGLEQGDHRTPCVCAAVEVGAVLEPLN